MIPSVKPYGIIGSNLYIWNVVFICVCDFDRFLLPNGRKMISLHTCVFKNRLWKVWKIWSSDELSCSFLSDKSEFVLKYGCAKTWTLITRARSVQKYAWFVHTLVRWFDVCCDFCSFVFIYLFVIFRHSISFLLLICSLFCLRITHRLTLSHIHIDLNFEMWWSQCSNK